MRLLLRTVVGKVAKFRFKTQERNKIEIEIKKTRRKKNNMSIRAERNEKIWKF